jgi:RNA polymerase II subunit A small phosphatase-like protein
VDFLRENGAKTRSPILGGKLIVIARNELWVISLFFVLFGFLDSCFRSHLHSQMSAIRRLVVFDLNGTLLARTRARSLNKRPHDQVVNNYRVWLRPFVKQFLRFCASGFDVGVWSSAMAQNVQPLVRYVFQDTLLQPQFVLDRSMTEPDSSPGAARHATIKDLARVYDLFPQYSPACTVILDDSVSKAVRNPFNIVCVPEFSADDMTREQFDSDDALMRLIPYLRCAFAEPDVRDFVRENPFYLAPLSPSFSVIGPASPDVVASPARLHSPQPIAGPSPLEHLVPPTQASPALDVGAASASPVLPLARVPSPPLPETQPKPPLSP